MLPAANHPNKPEMGTRELAFGRELYIERGDFMEDPPRKFFRLRPGGEVRLRYAYIIKCETVIKDDDGEIVELRCSYDPETRSGSEKAQRKVKGTIHWVAREHSARAEIRLYDRLFTAPRPGFGEDKLAFTESLNPESLTAVTDGRVEASLSGIDPQKEVQFERVGYFVADDIDSQPGRPVFNRIVTLRDSWAKIERAQQSKA
jgi:glutaminyl-tRNA synthetase